MQGKLMIFFIFRSNRPELKPVIAEPEVVLRYIHAWCDITLYCMPKPAPRVALHTLKLLLSFLSLAYSKWWKVGRGLQ